MTDDLELSPAQRLVRARWAIRWAAKRLAEQPEPPAGGDLSRELYGDLGRAARELVAAQDALDATQHDPDAEDPR
jgi:hypothetical protein